MSNKIGQATDLLMLGGIGFIGLLALNAMGGVKGLSGLFSGLSGLFGGIVPQQPTISTDPTPQQELELDYAQQAQYVPGQDVPITPQQATAYDMYLDARMQGLRQDLNSGLITQSTYSELLEGLQQRSTRIGGYQQAPAPTPLSPPPTPASHATPQMVAQQFMTGDITIEEATRQIQQVYAHAPTPTATPTAAPANVQQRYEHLIQQGRAEDAAAYIGVWG